MFSVLAVYYVKPYYYCVFCFLLHFFSIGSIHVLCFLFYVYIAWFCKYGPFSVSPAVALELLAVCVYACDLHVTIGLNTR